MSDVTAATFEERVAEPAVIGKGGRRGDLGQTAFKLALISCIALSFLLLAVLLVDVAADGLGTIDLDFITDYPSSVAAKAGIWPALLGTIWLMGVVRRVHHPGGRRLRHLPGGVRRPGPLVQPR